MITHYSNEVQNCIKGIEEEVRYLMELAVRTDGVVETRFQELRLLEQNARGTLP